MNKYSWEERSSYLQYPTMNQDYIKGYHVWWSPRYEAQRNRPRLNMLGRVEVAATAEQPRYRIQTPNGKIIYSGVSFASPTYRDPFNQFAGAAQYIGKVIS